MYQGDRMKVTIGFIHNLKTAVSFKDTLWQFDLSFKAEHPGCEFEYVFSNEVTACAQADLVFGLIEKGTAEEAHAVWDPQLKLIDIFDVLIPLPKVVDHLAEKNVKHADLIKFILKEKARGSNNYMIDFSRNSTHLVLAHMKGPIKHCIERKKHDIERKAAENLEERARRKIISEEILLRDNMLLQAEESALRTMMGVEESVQIHHLDQVNQGSITLINKEEDARKALVALELVHRQAVESAREKRKAALDVAKPMFDDLLAYGKSDTNRFWIAHGSRTLNSEINRKLARHLHRQLSEAESAEEMGLILSKAKVTNARLANIGPDLRSNKDYAEREINSKRLNAILDAGRLLFPAPSLVDFNAKKEKIRLALDNYISRVKTSPSCGFVFFVESRTASRVVNCKLAEDLVLQLSTAKTEQEIADIFTKENVDNTRKAQISDGVHVRGMNSKELRRALEHAQALFPMPVNQDKAVIPQASM
jgi:hypothetical protein